MRILRFLYQRLVRGFRVAFMLGAAFGPFAPPPPPPPPPPIEDNDGDGQTRDEQ
ncbi:MAG: hypothetical protein HOW73_09770 [Polyangiaceae bacterium]|nr:hypothetical protein [Polyangiaceae bacterium]